MLQGDALLAEAVRRVRQAIETQAANAQWRGRVTLAPGFADDAARNAVGGMLDLLAAIE